jgi:pantothenate kinase
VTVSQIEYNFKIIRNVHKISNLVNFCDIKTLVCPNPKRNPRKTLIGTLGGEFKFYTLWDQSANIKMIGHHKPSNFHIEGFSSSVEEIGLICKRTQEPLSG